MHSGTVGAQANRLEPIFKEPEYRKLVPQVTIRVGERIVNLLDAGHRAADALVRFSDLAGDLEKAFTEYRDVGHSSKLAKIAPTTFVFGAWDSRGTQAKIPRLINSTIRAYDVMPLTRSGQYFSVLEKEELEGFGIDASALGPKFPAEQGLVDNPVKRGPGGLIARGGVRREVQFNWVWLL